jgi:hypothetical protein
MLRTNKNRNRRTAIKLDLRSPISYKRFKFRENRRGVINHIRRDNRINNITNDDLN